MVRGCFEHGISLASTVTRGSEARMHVVGTRITSSSYGKISGAPNL